MLQDDFNRLAKSVDNLSEDQAKRICSAALERFKNEIGAFIVDIWTRIPGDHGIDFLSRFLHLGEGLQQNQPLAIPLTSSARGLLVWVAEFDQDVLLEDIAEKPDAARNSLDDKIISGQYVDVNPRTRCFAAVPITHRSQRAVLSIEADFSHSFKDYHVKTMHALAGQIGNVIWKASVFKENQEQTNEAIQTFASANTKAVETRHPYKSGFIARPSAKEYDQLETVVAETF
jgi:GAF domain-containing protein